MALWAIPRQGVRLGGFCGAEDLQKSNALMEKPSKKQQESNFLMSLARYLRYMFGMMFVGCL